MGSRIMNKIHTNSFLAAFRLFSIFRQVSCNWGFDPSTYKFDYVPFDPFDPLKPVIQPTKLVSWLQSPVTDLLGVTTVVTTSSGRVRGIHRISRSGKNFLDFRGIPYAKPPLDELRFEPPEPHPGWDGIHDGVPWSSPCLQPISPGVMMGDEDCLTLNIAARTVPSNHSLLPVMVFIHGGLFMSGTANFYPPLYFMDELIVLVTINYRLSALGFLNTGDGTVTGNMGLKDQTMALKWVKANIHNFHGNPEKITIFGESAGSVSVHLHTMSPLSRGLFSGAIAQSGTALAPWALVRNPASQAKELAGDMGCPTEDVKEMVACLKVVPGRRISNWDQSTHARYLEGKNSIFGPTLEVNSKAAFLVKSPNEILKSGDVSRTPLILGVNSADGLVYLIEIFRNEKVFQYVTQNWNKVLKTVFPKIRQHPDADSVIETLTKFYFKHGNMSIEHLEEAVTFMSDAAYFLDNHDVALMQSRVAPVYPYFYTYNGIFSIGDLLFSSAKLPLVGSDINNLMGTGINWLGANLLNRRSDNKFGVCHADELALLFNLPLVRKEIRKGDADYQFSKKFVRLWVSFAESGKPDLTKFGVDKNMWQPVHSSNPNFDDVTLTRLQLNDDVSLIGEPFFERLQLWKKLGLTYI